MLMAASSRLRWEVDKESMPLWSCKRVLLMCLLQRVGLFLMCASQSETVNCFWSISHTPLQECYEMSSQAHCESEKKDQWVVDGTHRNTFCTITKTPIQSTTVIAKKIIANIAPMINSPLLISQSMTLIVSQCLRYFN